ncbi:hypothetical protein WMY93_013837 [Mugilogobius chulae]|uniref:RanBP2-type domain-containing protein n=1 Tax=Mugilogobius chulae TaxID=88201 RepID=A0AAW0P153_9GOBI
MNVGTQDILAMHAQKTCLVRGNLQRKRKEKKKKTNQHEEQEEEPESEDEGEDPALDSLSQAIAFQQARIEEEEEVKHKKQSTSSLPDKLWSGMGDKRSPTRPKRQPKSSDEGLWDCSVCTYKNTAEAFKCMMCDVRKGTSTRKPRPVSQLVTQQQVTQQFVLPSQPKKEKKERVEREKGEREPALKKNSHKKMRPRLKNIDRSSAQHLEVTLGT